MILRYNHGVQAESLMGTYTPPDFYAELTKAQQAGDYAAAVPGRRQGVRGFTNRDKKVELKGHQPKEVRRCNAGFSFSIRSNAT